MTPSTLLRDATRNALHTDLLGALDYAESLRRGAQRISAERVGMGDDEWQRVRGCFEQAYNALAFARTLTEPNR